MKEKNVSIHSILLDVENPRIDPVNSQKAAIQSLLEKPGKTKFFKLVRDIMQNGLNPTEMIMCIPVKNGRGKTMYIVKEGNRRLLALKCIDKPELLNNDSLKKQIKKLLHTFGKAPLAPKKIKIAVFDESERDEMNHWIQNKHDGESGGAGTVPWGPSEKTRFSHQGTRKDLIRIVVEWLKNTASLTEQQKNNLSIVPTTTLERIIMSRPGRELVGIQSRDGQVILTRDSSATRMILNGIVEDLTTARKDSPSRKVINVSDVKNTNQIEKYLQKYSSSIGSPLEVPVLLEGEGLMNISPENDSPRDSTQALMRKAHKIPTAILKDKLSMVSKVAANDKILKLTTELTALNVAKTPLVFCLGLRSLLEISMRLFADKHKLPQLDNEEKTKKNTAMVSACVKTILTNDEWKQPPHKGNISCVENTLNQTSLLSLTEMNSLVHGTIQLPATETILTYVPRIIPFLVALNGGHPADYN